MPAPRIVIAGTHSGCGKTTVASGIMAALAGRGLKVQPFKVGPDFIDPSHHTRICGRQSRNLDTYMMGESGVAETFERAMEGADIAVIEGVMGMFDGVEGSDLASTAQVARILKAPVILVVDIKGMSRSVHALIRGYRHFDPTITIAGVIYNRVGSPRHRQMIEREGDQPSFGWLPRREDLAIESRHLGLKMAHESATMKAYGPLVEEFCDLDAILSAAGTAPDLGPAQKSGGGECTGTKIGVASDEAFCFYYQDNFDRIRKAGAEIVFFSPLADRLPRVDGLYLGGGYPELHLPSLEGSKCTGDIKRVAEEGMPILAECGGLLYLSRELASDKTYRMCSVLPAVSEMTKKIQALGYVEGSGARGGAFVPAGTRIRGHEFHYSQTIADRDARFAFELTRGKGIADGCDGIMGGNAVGTYTHAYFAPEFAVSFVRAAENFRNR
ncbi:MAG: cobyrinate a,c-diamide synthase [Methanoregula sp.]|nr:cobyrinate a,c-diamide synthase [Methanoregula sp.]